MPYLLPGALELGTLDRFATRFVLRLTLGAFLGVADDLEAFALGFFVAFFFETLLLEPFAVFNPIKPFGKAT